MDRSFHAGHLFSAYWDQTRSTNSFQFAWAAMAGVSYALTRNASIDVGYRYLGFRQGDDLFAVRHIDDTPLYAQEVRLGRALHAGLIA